MAGQVFCARFPGCSRSGDAAPSCSRDGCPGARERQAFAAMFAAPAGEHGPEIPAQPAPEAVADPMLQFFRYEHLPPELAAQSKPFGDLAAQLVATLPRNPERTAALRKLLEAKDCAVRARLYREP